MKARDLTGQRFAMLTALYPVEGRRDRCVMWMCRCDCGQEKAVPSTDLTRGRVKSCGCLRHKVKDITGERRGHLVALEATGRKDARGHGVYRWRCDCGRVFERSVSGTAREGARMCPDCRRALKSRQIGQARDCRVLDDATGLTAKDLHNIVDGVLSVRNTSGVRGVYWHQGHHRWVANGRLHGERVNLGEFATLEEAREARERFVQKVYGAAAMRLGVEMPSF